MKKTLFLLVLLVGIIYPQEVKQKIVVTNGANNQDLYFGLDPSATDGIDASLGEASLPPLPPTGVFDARFKVSSTESSETDYREGTSEFVGTKIHEIQYQLGDGASTITISWN